LKDDTIIPKSDATLGLEYAEGLSFNNLLNKQADATIQNRVP
jgi:glucose-6-phosphate isomerase